MFPNFDTESPRKYEYFRCCLLVEGFISNVIVLGIFFAKKNMRTPVNYFEANLSIAEIVFTIVNFARCVTIISQEMEHIDIPYMATIQFDFGWIESVLLFTTIAISIHRYRLIKNPSKFETNPRLVLCRMGVIWFTALVYNVMLVALYHLLNMREKFTSNISIESMWLSTVIGAAVPYLSLIAIAIFYAILSFRLTKYGIAGQQAPQNANNMWTRKIEIIIMLITVAIPAVSWLPLIFTLVFIQLVCAQSGHEIRPKYFFSWPGNSICRTLSILHVVCLPIMHYFTSSGYRSGFNNLVAMCCRAITCGNYKIPDTHNGR